MFPHILNLDLFHPSMVKGAKLPWSPSMFKAHFRQYELRYTVENLVFPCSLSVT